MRRGAVAYLDEVLGAPEIREPITWYDNGGTHISALLGSSSWKVLGSMVSLRRRPGGALSVQWQSSELGET